MKQATKELLQKKNVKFLITLKNGVTMKNMRVEYVGIGIVLFVHKNGEHKAINHIEIEDVEEEEEE